MAGQRGKVLIVDDNRSILNTLEILLSAECEETVTLSNPNLINSELRKKEYDLVLLDMNFKAGVNSGNEGIFWLSKIREIQPEVSVIMITAYGDIETAVRALKAGAEDFVLKPWDNQKLIATIKIALELSFSRKEVRNLKARESLLKKEINSDHRNFIGSSPGITDVLNLVRKVAKTDANVLITGENGTGKELIAKELHRLSHRSKELMVSVDIGSLPETLFESEVFGHSKGAFTDARESRQGKFEVADKGTLFLDEIGNLSFHLQAKLLAAIENRNITRLGSNEPVPVDIRLICATNKNLSDLVARGLFREDLLYRINTIQIELPPLRERGNDIISLAEFFLNRFTRKYGKPEMKINRQAISKLMDYNWPGNVRELQNTVEKAVILCEGDIIKPEDLYLRPAIPSNNPDSIETLEEMEREMIRLALEKHNGNYTAAATQLGITRQTLYNRMKKRNDK